MEKNQRANQTIWEEQAGGETSQGSVRARTGNVQQDLLKKTSERTQRDCMRVRLAADREEKTEGLRLTERTGYYRSWQRKKGKKNNFRNSNRTLEKKRGALGGKHCAALAR